jgi:hypothetical protein
MTVSLTYDEERTVEDGNLYQVKQTVTNADNISANIFVFKTVDETFAHVATVYDLEKIASVTKVEAETAGEDYYRLDTVTRSWESLDTATEYSNYNQTRIQWLVNEYAAFTDTFAADVTITLTSG